MNRSKCVQLAARAFAVVLLGAAAANAHHSGSAYDQSKSVEIKGTITKFAFVNPHAYAYFTATDANGKPVEWRCELAARLALSRLGWTPDTLKPGMVVTFKGAPGRNEERVCVTRSIVMADGKEISAREALVAATTAAPSTTAHDAKLANGHPNLAGNWVRAGGDGPGRGAAGGARGAGGPAGAAPAAAGGAPRAGGPPAGGRGRGPEQTEAGVAAQKAYDQPFDDPAIKCDPANIIFGWTHDGHVNQIVEKDDAITLKYGYMDLVRTIYMNQATHPKNLKDTRGGHSIGKWDGDVLEVDTVAMSAGALIPISGVMFTNKMHVVERFSLSEDAKKLTRAYSITDPLYIKGTFTGQDTMTLTDEPYVLYNCVELSGKNNIRATKK